MSANANVDDLWERQKSAMHPTNKHKHKDKDNDVNININVNVNVKQCWHLCHRLIVIFQIFFGSGNTFLGSGNTFWVAALPVTRLYVEKTF